SSAVVSLVAQCAPWLETDARRCSNSRAHSRAEKIDAELNCDLGHSEHTFADNIRQNSANPRYAPGNHGPLPAVWKAPGFFWAEISPIPRVGGVLREWHSAKPRWG